MVAHNGAETAPEYDEIATVFTLSYFLRDGLNQLKRKRLALKPLPKLHRTIYRSEDCIASVTKQYFGCNPQLIYFQKSTSQTPRGSDSLWVHKLTIFSEKNKLIQQILRLECC